MRSRLEARWAWFFDQLGIHWSYEPDAEVIEHNIYYAPDFWLDLREEVYAEVKPKLYDVDPFPFYKAKNFARITGKRIFLLGGMPSDSVVGYCRDGLFNTTLRNRSGVDVSWAIEEAKRRRF